MPTLLEVMESRLGVQEVRGKKHNAIILGWANEIGHPEVVDDETSWCSICVASAAQEAGLALPARNVRMLARSWLTWGIKVEPKNIQPGDVAIWRRGDPKAWQGHVNVVKEVTNDGRVRCIGGNQSMAGGDAVTVTMPLNPKSALGFRRAVPATVPALRKAGSTEIKQADRIENGGWLVTAVSAVIAAIQKLLGPVEVPTFATLPESLTWWQTILGGFNAVADLALAHPWLCGTLIVGLLSLLVSRQLKAKRVEKHAAGVPLSNQLVVAI